MRWADLPNLITIGRMLAVIPLVWLLMEERYVASLIVALIAGASDAVDGYLAKRFDWQSRVGGILDPLADKLLLMCSYIVLAAQGVLPVWLVMLILGRDVIIISGGLGFHYTVARVEPEPTLISKLNTFCQIVLVLAVLLHLSLWPLPKVALDGLIAVVTATTIISGLHYMGVWGRRAWLTKADRS